MWAAGGCLFVENIFSHELQTHDNNPKVIRFVMGGKTKENGGLNIFIHDGFLRYTKNDGKQTGSKKARDFMIGVMDNDGTITVDWGENNIFSGNNVWLNFDEICAQIDGISHDLNKMTSGYGMTLIHEMAHTTIGGDKTDVGEDGSMGTDIAFTNVIRKQLGKQFGNSFGQEQRHSYYLLESDPDNAYFAYSPDTARVLEEKSRPTSKFIKIPLPK